MTEKQSKKERKMATKIEIVTDELKELVIKPISDEDLGKLYLQLKNLSAAIKPVMDQAKKRVTDGNKVPGLVLRVKDGSQFIPDVAQCAKECAGIVDEAEFMSSCTITLKALTDLVVPKIIEKHNCTKKAATDVLKKNITIETKPSTTAVELAPPTEV